MPLQIRFMIQHPQTFVLLIHWTIQFSQEEMQDERPNQRLRYPLALDSAVSNSWNFIRVLCSSNSHVVTNLVYPGLALRWDLLFKTAVRLAITLAGSSKKMHSTGLPVNFCPKLTLTSLTIAVLEKPHRSSFYLKSDLALKKSLVGQ